MCDSCNFFVAHLDFLLICYFFAKLLFYQMYKIQKSNWHKLQVSSKWIESWDKQQMSRNYQEVKVVPQNYS